jgi:hypothetical protein
MRVILGFRQGIDKTVFFPTNFFGSFGHGFRPKSQDFPEQNRGADLIAKERSDRPNQYKGIIPNCQEKIRLWSENAPRAIRRDA